MFRCHYHGADWHYLVFPRALHNAFLKNWPQVGLYFTIEKSTWPYLDYKCVFPTSNLVYLKSCSDVLTKHSKQLREMLADTTRLEVLDLFTWYGYQFSMGDEKLPPVKHLFLRQCDWKHSPAAVKRIFDFSQLETLVLEPGHWWQDILPFLRSVTAEQFPRLKKLEIMNKQESTSTTSYGKEVNDLLQTSLDWRTWQLKLSIFVFGVCHHGTSWRSASDLELYGLFIGSSHSWAAESSSGCMREFEGVPPSFGLRWAWGISSKSW